MPFILRPEDEQLWLDVFRISFAKARSLLKPNPDELMAVYDVPPAVNSANYDGPECIQPASDDDTPPAGQLSLL
jgi:putative SOS response-associated peptidase YedK